MVDIAKNHRSADIADRPTTRPHTAPMPPVVAGPPLRKAGHANPTARVADDLAPMRRSPAESSTRSATAARYLLAGVRLALGWVFLWAFLDKAFGLGFATSAARAWIDGGSPT